LSGASGFSAEGFSVMMLFGIVAPAHRDDAVFIALQEDNEESAVILAAGRKRAHMRMYGFVGSGIDVSFK
jgi:hypothetical protein